MQIPPAAAQPIKVPSQDLGVSYNRQAKIQEQNAKTGMDYNYNKEVSAKNAELVVNLLA